MPLTAQPDAQPDSTQTAAAAANAAPAPGDNFALSLTEFCTRLSSADKRVELIGAFFHVETQAGRIKDTDANFSARYRAFLSQPV